MVSADPRVLQRWLRVERVSLFIVEHAEGTSNTKFPLRQSGVIQPVARVTRTSVRLYWHLRTPPLLSCRRPCPIAACWCVVVRATCRGVAVVLAAVVVVLLLLCCCRYNRTRQPPCLGC